MKPASKDSKISQMMNRNVKELLMDCEKKTKRQVEAYLVALKPKPEFEPTIRRQPARYARAKATQLVGDSPSPVEGDGETSLVTTAAPSSVNDRSTNRFSLEKAPLSVWPPLVQSAQPDAYNFRFAADGAFKAKLDRLAEVLGIVSASKNIVEILESALDIALDRKDPQRKQERRIKRERSKSAPSPHLPGDVAESLKREIKKKGNWGAPGSLGAASALNLGLLQLF